MARRYSKLRGRIVECFGSYAKFSAHMGIKPVKMSYMLTDSYEWTIPEALKYAAELNITNAELVDFFCPEG